MKKLLIIACMVFAGYTANAQFSAGVYGALPMGDADDITTFGLGVDLSYLFEVSEAFAVGPTAGLANLFGDSEDTPFGSIDIDDATYIPIAVAGRFYVSEAFTLGADLGYGVGVSDYLDGGFYYAPRVAYSASDLIDIVLSYRGVSEDGFTMGWLGLGVEFGIN